MINHINYVSMPSLEMLCQPTTKKSFAPAPRWEPGERDHFVHLRSNRQFHACPGPRILSPAHTSGTSAWMIGFHFTLLTKNANNKIRDPCEKQSVQF